MTGSQLGELADLVGADLSGERSVTVSDVTHDSRLVRQGSLFVALRGSMNDGHDFVDRAIEAGAAAVCVEDRRAVTVPQLVVSDTRRVMGRLAASVYGNPSHDLKVIGVTGTNGKTTVTHFVESIARSAGLHPGLIGTIETRAGDTVFESERTTPESSDFQRLLASMRDLGCELVAAEVSSHALALHRVAGTRFDVAAFTNLSQDHLDFHGDMEAYRVAKESFFSDHDTGTAVVNIDDPAGREIAERMTGTLVTVGGGGDTRVRDIRVSTAGTTFYLDTPWGGGDVESSLVGDFNLDNAMVAATCCLVAGMGLQDVLSGVAAMPGVPGRFERVSGDHPVTVIVDYAHTPDGIRMVLENARHLTSGRVIALVGAGGDRDRQKRPMMGAAVSEADLAVITSDNPRSEDPEAILDAVASGVESDASYILQVDRHLAIRSAIESASPGDLVLLLGRGHEPFQEIGAQMIPFDDRQVARRVLDEIRSSTNFDTNEGSMGP